MSTVNGNPVLKRPLAALLLLFVANISFSADNIKIAIAGPSTGPVAQYGEMQLTGVRMAIDQINKTGGINGKMLEGVTYDDACDPKQAVAVANRIVNDHIKFVVGHVCSSSTQPATDIYEDERILMVTGSATNPQITGRGLKLIFRTIGLDNQQAPVAAGYIAKTLKPKAVAVLHDKQQYGEGLATEVKRELEAEGVNVVLFEGINAGDKDYSSIISKLARNNVDLVYYGGYHPELGLLLRQAAEKGLKSRFMGAEGAANIEVSAIAGPATEGLLVTMPPAFDQELSNQVLMDAFKANNQDPSGAFVLTWYSAVKVIADAIKYAGSEDPLKVADALHSHSFETPIGTIGFDDRGDLKNFRFVVYNWHPDGSRTLAK